MRPSRVIVSFVKFALVGGIGLLLTLALTHVLTTYLHLWYFVSFLVATAIAWTFVFFANAFFSFGDIPARLTLERYGTFFLGYLSFFWISAAIVYCLTSLIGVPYIISIVAGTVTTTILTFLFNKFVVFTPGERISLKPLYVSIQSVSREQWMLVGVVALALVLRVPGVHYGLPLHLIADEEVNVYAALKMLEIQTLFPVFHPQAFVPLLYEPPMTAYFDVLLFIPTILLVYIAWGFPALSAFKNMLIVDSSIFFFVARFGTIVLSLCNVCLVYRITRNFFDNSSVALLSAFFLATSFLDVTISNTARHWTLGIFFSLLAFLLLQEAVVRTGKSRLYVLAAAGFATGFSFGTSYLVYYLPFFGLYLLYTLVLEHGLRMHALLSRRFLVPILSFGMPLVATAIVMLAVDPYAFEYQVLTPATKNAWKSVGEFVRYYAGTLVNFETPLLIFAAIGVVRLFFVKRVLFFLISSLLIVSFILTYLFLNYLTRYVIPLIPIFSLLAGFGLYEVVRFLPARRISVVIIAVCLIGYFGAMFGRYDVLVARNDTRHQVKQWIEGNIMRDSTVIVNSDDIRLQGNPSSLALQSSLDPSSLRSSDKALMSSPYLASHPLDLYNLFYLSPSLDRELLESGLAGKKAAYFVFDSWAPARQSTEVFLKGVEVKRIEGTDKLGAPDLLIGGDYTGSGTHILRLLYGASNLGPTVVVYSVPL